VPKTSNKSDNKRLRDQTVRLRDAMAWLSRGFTLFDPRKRYPGFYLSPQQSYVLTIVSEEGPISPGEVAKKLRLEKSHLTKIVNSLIEMGAFEKSTDEHDRRRLLLTLTSKGIKIYKELEEVGIKSYMALMERIPEKERENVIRATQTMLNAMNSLREEAE